MLSKPYQTAQSGARGQVRLGTASEAEIQKNYPQLLALRPPERLKFTLFFDEGGAQLTPSSQSQLTDIVRRAGERPGSEIIVTGHTVRMESLQANDTRSLNRAQRVRELLIGHEFHPDLIEAVGRGEREPTVETVDEVSEPRNRRVEEEVR